MKDPLPTFASATRSEVLKRMRTDHQKIFERSVRPLEPLMASRIPIWKRVLDKVAASSALVLSSPLLLLIAAVIKIGSPGPIIFKQVRVGYLGNKFTLWKFRTMKVNADTSTHQSHLTDLMGSDKPLTKLDLKEDSRIIRFGKIFRQSGLDELPQIINILRGEMSLIGPRPCLPYEVESYLQWQKRRFDVLPGITGLWQVNGKNRTTFTEMMRLDMRYARELSFWLDAKIMFKTIPAIIRQIQDGRTVKNS